MKTVKFTGLNVNSLTTRYFLNVKSGEEFWCLLNNRQEMCVQFFSNFHYLSRSKKYFLTGDKYFPFRIVQDFG